MRQAIETLGLRVLFGIRAVNAVDIGGLEHDLGPDLGRPQHRSRVGGEERIAGSAAEQDDTEGVAACEILAGELDHDATIDRLSHCLSLPCPAQVTSGAIAPEDFDRSGYFLPLAAATSAAKSDSCFSIPSPRA